MFFICYIYFGYPLLLLIFGFFKNRKVNFSKNYLPSVSLIVAAYNEEMVIEEKIENSLKLDYPKEMLEIIIFSDSSTDNTDKIVKKYEEVGVKLLKIGGRKGKTFCQNIAVEKARGEIIIFSDANSIYQKDAIKNIVKNFADGGIGCVSGELKYCVKSGEGVHGEGVYWRYERIIKKMESQISSVVSANGSIYAVRKRDYIPLDKWAISDFAQPLKQFLKNYRIIYEPEAIAWESTANDWKEEYRRRVRIVTRTFNNFIQDKEMHKVINPVHFGIFSIQFITHKLLRWFSGLFLLLLLSTNLLLYNQGVLFQLLCCGQIIFYLTALYGLLAEIILRIKNFKIAHVIFYFCLSCWAMLVGVFKAIMGENIVSWEVRRN